MLYIINMVYHTLLQYYCSTLNNHCLPYLDNKMISKNVKYYRIYNNSPYADVEGRISQEKLAQLCNVSRSLIANIESVKVKQTFSISVIASISKVLNVSFENFFKENK